MGDWDVAQARSEMGDTMTMAVLEADDVSGHARAADPPRLSLVCAGPFRIVTLSTPGARVDADSPRGRVRVRLRWDEHPPEDAEGTSAQGGAGVTFAEPAALVSRLLAAQTLRVEYPAAGGRPVARFRTRGFATALEALRKECPGGY